MSRAWEERDNFKDMFNKENEKENRLLLFFKWAQSSINKNIKEISKVVMMFKNHIPGVLNALITNFTNAMAERLNGKRISIKT